MTTIHALCGGMIELDRSSFFSDVAPGTRITIPVMCFLISHPRGHVLVDTGVHRQARTDPVGRMGERRASLFGMRSAPTDEVVSQLALLGLAPSDVRYVVNSHLHFDHCGGNEFFPSSTFLVQRAEMDAARRVLGGLAMRYTPSAIDFDHPLDYQLVDGEHDLFGDRPARAPADLRPHARSPVAARACGQGDGARPDGGRVLHAGEHGPRHPAHRALGPRGDVALAGRAPGLAGQEGRDRHLRPRRRPVADNAPRPRHADLTAQSATGIMTITSAICQLRTTDLAESIRFYTAVVGLTLEFQYEDFYAGIRAGNSVFHLKLVDQKDPSIEFVDHGDHFHLYLETDDVAAAADALKRNGVHLVSEVHDTAWGTREFVIKDNQGHTVYFGEHR
jgi:catechol 2,3-dioxygenase-like lactoylglutathione lyase family enzyme